MTPSPQIGMHGFPATGQRQPASTAEQSAEQPSPLVVLPSSQASGAVSMPSPQMSLRTQGWPTVGQIQPFSIWQSGVQPSPPNVVAVVALLTVDRADRCRRSW